MQPADARLIQRIGAHFADSAKLKSEAASVLGEPIAQAGLLLAQALKAGGKALACGNGGSAAGAQHFAAELVNRFEAGRAPLGAVGFAPSRPHPSPIAHAHPRGAG